MECCFVWVFCHVKRCSVPGFMACCLRLGRLTSRSSSALVFERGEHQVLWDAVSGFLLFSLCVSVDGFLQECQVL